MNTFAVGGVEAPVEGQGWAVYCKQRHAASEWCSGNKRCQTTRRSSALPNCTPLRHRRGLTLKTSPNSITDTPPVWVAGAAISF